MMIDERIAEEMTPRAVQHWGITYENFAPVLVEKVFGDGQRLLFLTPLATRPNYYVARVDSTLREDDEREFVEHQLFDAIMDEFGDADDANGDDGDEEGDSLPWPALDTSCGFVWSIENHD